MRILFFNFETALGSAIHASPVYASLFTQASDLEINLLSNSLALDVLGNHPVFHKVWVSPNPYRFFYKTCIWLLKNRNGLGKFDKIIFSSGNSRTKLLLLSFLIKAKSREGFAIKKQLLNKVIEYDDRISLIANNLKVIELLGNGIKITQTKPEIWIGQNDFSKAQQILNHLTNGEISRKRIGFFAGTSGGHPNNWFLERFINLSKKLINETGAICFFFGGEKDKESNELIVNSIGENAFSLSGKTTIRELTSFCASLDLLITLDTGGMHVGWAAEVPMIVLGHAAEPKHVWLPLESEIIKIIRKDEMVPCALCKKHFCATRECMDAISEKEVFDLALNFLNQTDINQRGIRNQQMIRELSA